MGRHLCTLVPFVLAVAPLLPLGCSTFGSDDPTPMPGGPDVDASTTSPDANTPVMGQPDRGLTIAVGDPKATSFVMQGGSLAVPVKLTRRTSSTGAVDVTVAKLPADVTADPLTIPEGATEATLLLRAKPTSVQGGPTTLDITAIEKGPLGTGTSTKLSAFVRGGRGALDTTFADKGQNLDVFGGEATFFDAKMMSTGAVVAVARSGQQSVVARFTAAGVLDPSFAMASGGGTSVLTVSRGTTHVDLFEPVSPAKSFIWALESGALRPTLFRRNIDGPPDVGFNTTGTVSIEDGLGGNAQGLDLIALADGKALVLVSHASGATAVSRWNADGSLDTTYGVDGACQVSGALRMQRRAGGGVLLLGRSSVRGCSATGAVDTTVGAPPDYAVPSDANDWSTASDGGLVFLKNVVALNPQASRCYWNRWSSALVKNTSIGVVGDVGGQMRLASAVVAQRDGGVVVGGSVDADFRIVRFTPAGKLDTAFGTGGTAAFIISPGAGEAHLTEVIEQDDGRLLILGSTELGFNAIFLRIWP